MIGIKTAAFLFPVFIVHAAALATSAPAEEAKGPSPAGAAPSVTAPALPKPALPAVPGAAGVPNVPAGAPSQAPGSAAAAPGALAPDAAADKVVEAYLKAMQGQRFAEAYDYVSKTLKAGKSREEWAKEQQYIVQMGEVKIFGFKVFAAAVQTDGSARVPNILKSQDKYLNQLGLDEYELYELVREEGQWRIDQQTLVEGADRAEYFPEDAVQP